MSDRAENWRQPELFPKLFRSRICAAHAGLLVKEPKVFQGMAENMASVQIPRGF
ncbi:MULTISPECIES: hypothetical protein [unclassified Pseudomonas]|uniref:hypothetical protein n=1 Tax=unclassified Pseudomonas TaxID=196821 RepID=UPI00200EE484|nr:MULTISPECIES: hypothetical protein [unclassified Pseudomonas]